MQFTISGSCHQLKHVRVDTILKCLRWIRVQSSVNWGMYYLDSRKFMYKLGVLTNEPPLIPDWLFKIFLLSLDEIHDGLTIQMNPS